MISEFEFIHRFNLSCKERAIYVLSRHESIDNAELTVLDMIAKSVCIEPKLLYHGHVHGMSLASLASNLSSK